jgi:hypothetical protein
MNFADALRAVRKSTRPVGFSKGVSPGIRPVPSVVQHRSASEAACRTENAIREAVAQGDHETKARRKPRARV